MPRHRTSSDVGWIKRELNALRRMIEADRAARRLEAANIGKGGLHVRGGDIFLEDDAGNVIWQASTDPIKTGMVYADGDGLSIPTTWSVLGFGSIAAPVGFVGTGHFIVMVSCGDTMSSGTGSVSAQPVMRYRYADGSASAWFSGPAIASPANSIAVTSSLWATNFGMSATVAALEIGVNCVRSFGTETGTDGNWHVAASVIFKRG